MMEAAGVIQSRDELPPKALAILYFSTGRNPMRSYLGSEVAEAEHRHS
jgi:hypothetical protein